ncbi:MAG: alanine racemase [Chloroflexi bacterium]|nr:alanine racemase [Chloroflexota bacterium]
MAQYKSDLDTPALIVNIDKLKFNIQDMADFAAAEGIQLRPHAKTHKTPEIGKLQLEAGAVGLTVAKLSEAQVFIDAGCREILVAYPLVGPAKHRRLIELCQRANITTVLDHVDIAAALSRSMSANGLELPVMIEVDTGLERCGVPPGAPASELAQGIARLPGLRFAGLLTHEGHAQLAGAPDQVRATGLSAGRMMAETAELIRKSGLEVPIISVGLTATAKITATVAGVTETRPGIYVFYDRSEVLHKVVRPDRCAARVLATVATRPTADRIILDAGTKALTSDRAGVSPPVMGHGLVIDHPDWEIKSLSEEHGATSIPPDDPARIGDRVEIIPNHICPVINLFDSMFITQGERVIDEWMVAARGKSQ